MTFSSGLFGLDLGFWDPSPTLAWAECDVDLMGQPVIRFHHVVATALARTPMAGTASSSYGSTTRGTASTWLSRATASGASKRPLASRTSMTAWRVHVTARPMGKSSLRCCWTQRAPVLGHFL